jgi:hypothetical protein
MPNKAAVIATVIGMGELLVLAVAGPAAAAPATVTVCASGCDAVDIQAAVDLAAPGDTITVAAGTYSEVVTFDKAGLILKGAQAGVDARSRTGAETVISQGQFRLAADGITIDGFAFDDAHSNAVTPAAAIYGSGFSGTQIVNDVIENSMFRAQFDNAGPAAARIADNVFRDNDANYPTGGTGVFMLGAAGGSHNVTIEDNDFSGHPNAAMNVVGHDLVVRATRRRATRPSSC